MDEGGREMPDCWYSLRPSNSRHGRYGRCAGRARSGSRGLAALSAGIAASIAAARQSGAEAEPPWVQLDLAVAPEARARAEFCAELGVAAREFLGARRARNFFFLHSDRGIRVCFQAGAAVAHSHDPNSSAGTAELRAALLDRLAHCKGVVARTRPVCAVYEPEHYLFGGPESMPYVHDLFTLDSFAWLDHHAECPGREGRLTAWRLSLLMLGELFAGLGIAGWEHRGVWHTLRGQTVRGPRGATDEVRATTVADRAVRRQAAAGIVAYWCAPREATLATFPEERREALARHADAVRETAARWRAGYFEAGEATVGPRTAAAHFAAFHWNRGRLSLARQNLLTDALADEGSVPYAVTRPLT
jgi:thiopeptide-type bacteriocin biosynthesis protein